MSRVIPPYNAVGPNSFLGLPMCQNRFAVPTWSYAMEILPPAQIIELGTYGGGFTVAIAPPSTLIVSPNAPYSYRAPKLPLARLISSVTLPLPSYKGAYVPDEGPA